MAVAGGERRHDSAIIFSQSNEVGEALFLQFTRERGRAWCKGEQGMAIETINPTTGERLAMYETFTPERVDRALTRAKEVARQWRRTSFEERRAGLRALAGILRSQRDALALLATQEMGKPVIEARAEVEKAAVGCEYYAEHGEHFLAPEVVETNARESFVAYRPLGVVLAIMPWNFPYWQVLRAAAPIIMAGNTMVLKHASNVTGCALALERVLREAGFPEGVFQALILPGSGLEPVIRDERIAAVTLTGSEETGSAVAAIAGRALKKLVLELGGSDPFIVLEDADLEQCVHVAVRARFQNCGQSCIAAKRFIVVGQIAKEFEERYIETVRALRVGDPREAETRIGPIARKDLREDVHQQVMDSVGQGAKLGTGGRYWPERGFFYTPTVLLGVTPAMRASREEVFGPVAAIMRVPDAETAIAVANDSIYGLGSNLWTTDIERGKRLAAAIEAGQVFINGMTASDPRLPFGGVKHSGYGRELSWFGIREFVNIQTVWIGPANS